jgi:hypothetical protein
MNQIDKKTVKVIREELNKVQESLSKTLGMKLDFGSISYAEDEFRVRLSGVVVKNKADMSKPKVELEAENNYNQYHKIYGLPSGLIGKKVKIMGENVTFLGIHGRSRKYPYLFKSDKNDKYVRYTEEAALSALK